MTLTFTTNLTITLEARFRETGDARAVQLITDLFNDAIDDIEASLPGHILAITMDGTLTRPADPHWFRDGPIWGRAA